MKKIILLFYVSALISCKKNAETINNEDITKVKWVLESAVLDRPMEISGGATTDYIVVSGPNSCIGSNYTMTFSPDGTYQISSTGALCDMVANSKNQTWVRENATTIILNKNSTSERKMILNGNDTFAYTVVNTPGVVYWAVLYTFKAKPK